MTKREKAPSLLILVGLMIALPLTCLLWWWASNQHDESMDLRDNISVLAPTPDWKELDVYQNTITREEFSQVLTGVYSEGPAWKTSININDDHAVIRAPDQPYRLNFAESPSSESPKRYWRSAAEMPIDPSDAEDKPLKGIKIAIDPGHIGGEWAKMEERWYQIGGQGTEVKEGELTLSVAKLLETKLEALGAKVTLVRDKNEPVTKRRPEDFIELATRELALSSPTPKAIKTRSEIMFYRWSEIRARAKKVNTNIKPDLTLCAHFNAEAWGNPTAPLLGTSNHLHFLINGTYSNAEFSLHDQRLDLMKRLLQRIHPEELAVSTAVAESLAPATGLPPYVYTRPSAKLISDNDYIYARNLMAGRIYYCPIVYLEPYVMNSQEVYERIGAGDYAGEREVAGRMRKSIFQEYADGVVDGLVAYYRSARPKKS